MRTQKFKVIKLFYWLILFGSKLFGQTNSDSLFLNSIMNENLYQSYWNNTGKWYVNDSITSLSGLYARLNSEFKFQDTEFYSAYDYVQTSDSIRRDTLVNPSLNQVFMTNANSGYKQLNPLYTLDFSLNGKSSTSFFTYSPSTLLNPATKTGFLIIPGSNINQTTDIIKGVGYHNLHCLIKNKLVTLGDVFIYTKPDEDYRALYRNKKKLNSGDYYTPGSPSFLYNYLNANNKPYGVNYLIECFALIKYMHQKYDKVIVLGCSQGGYAALLTSLNSKIDGVVISAGYSINFDNSASDIYALQQNFGVITTNLIDTVVKSSIQQAKTDYLFTWGNNDSYWYQQEYNFQHTQNFFGYMPHVSYFYNYNNHAFPPCANLDTFIQRIVAKPKVTFQDSLTCFTDSALLKVKLVGVPPFSFSLYKDNIPFQNYISNSKTFLLPIYQEGQYVIKNIQDASLVTGFDSDPYVFKKDTLSNFSKTVSSPNCNTSSSSVVLNLNHSNATNLYYRLNGVSQIDNIAFPANYTFNNNSSIILDSVVDEHQCKLLLNENLIFNFPSLSAQVDTPMFMCGSGNTLISMTFTGTPPYKIFFTKNGIVDSLVINQNTYSLITNNGLYHFMYFQDATQCTLPINKTFNIENYTLDIQLPLPVYVQDSNKTKQQIICNGNPPFQVYYRKNGVAKWISTSQYNLNLFLDNGFYQFDSVSDLHCKRNIQPLVSYTVNNIPLQIGITNLGYQCDSNKTSLRFDIQGNPPWTIQYLKNGLLQNFVTSNANQIKLFENGFYQFLSVSNALNTIIGINQGFNFNYQPLQVQIQALGYNCNTNLSSFEFTVSGNPPFILEYQKGTVVYYDTFSTAVKSLALGNGDWTFNRVLDATNCEYLFSGANYNLYYLPLSAGVSKNEYNCDLKKRQVDVQLAGTPPYTIYYRKLGVANGNSSMLTNQNVYSLYLSKGNYMMDSVKNGTGCIVALNQFIGNDVDSLTYNLLSTTYNCADAKMKFTVLLTGVGPWKLYFRNTANNSTSLVTAFTPIKEISFAYGNYILDSIRDGQCLQTYSAAFNNNVMPFQAQVNGNYISCDSQKNFIVLSQQGGIPPYTYQITENLQPITLSTYQLLDTFYMKNNSVAVIATVADSLGCLQSIGQSYISDFVPFNFDVVTNQYNCLTDQTLVTFTMSFKDSVQLVYSKNGQTKPNLTFKNNQTYSFDNGNYEWQFALTDYQCQVPIGKSLAINNEPVNIDMDTANSNCATNQYAYGFEFQGKSPWTLTYNENNITRKKIFSNASDSLYVLPGNYFFLEIMDGNHCIDSIGKIDSLPSFFTSSPSLVLQNNILRLLPELPDKYTISWFYNNENLMTENLPTLELLGSGQYIATINDLAGCTYSTPPFDLSLPNELNIYPNPGKDQVLVTMNYSDFDFCQYAVYDISGRRMINGVSEKQIFALDIHAWPAGLYTIQVIVDGQVKVYRFSKV